MGLAGPLCRARPLSNLSSLPPLFGPENNHPRTYLNSKVIEFKTVAHNIILRDMNDFAWSNMSKRITNEVCFSICKCENMMMNIYKYRI